MPTNDERREVAKNLRELEVGDFTDGRFYDWGEVETALGLVDYGSWYKEADVLRLADLIEPEPERTCHNDLKDSDYGGVWPIPHFKCSSCGGLFASYEFDYCPNCGAKVVSE